MASVQAAGFLKAIRRTGFFDPATVAAFAAAAAMWGASSATPYAAAAARHPNRLALTDDYGSVSYRQLDWRTSRVAAGLRRTGIKRGASVGLLCRNHRGFVEANVALAKVGCPVIYLNTGLPKAQMDQVIEREGVTAVVADSGLVDRVSAGVKLIVAAPEDNPSWSFPDLGQPRLPIQFPRPWKVANPVLLTSGTSGAPRGTQRSPGAKASLAALGFLAVMPFSRGDVFVVPAPLFHAWGLSQLLLSSVLAGTVVLRNSFEPALAAADVEAHQASVLAAVPVMLSRILTAAPDADLSSLRITATSGSALPGQLGDQWMDAFGNNLHNLYGSTEVGQVSLADPRDLRAAPGTAGRALPGVNIRVVDAAGREIKAGKTGRIVVKSEMHFDGYTGGGSKELVEGYMDIGDDGYLDSHGRLFVAGRARICIRPQSKGACLTMMKF